MDISIAASTDKTTTEGQIAAKNAEIATLIAEQVAINEAVQSTRERDERIAVLQKEVIGLRGVASYLTSKLPAEEIAPLEK